MVNTRRSKSKNKQDNNVPGGANAEAYQPLIVETLRNLNQFFVTQAQLMQQIMQQMNNNNNIPTTTAPSAHEQYSYDGLQKIKPPEVSHNDDVSHFLSESHHPWKYVICYRCGETGHFAYRCPQKGKPRQEVHCVNCHSIGHDFTKCPKRKVIQYQVCNHCGKKGHFVKQCPFQAFLAQATSASEDGTEESRMTHQAAKISQPIIRSQVNQVSTEETQESNKRDSDQFKNKMDNPHKRKLEDQEQNVARNPKAQPNHAPTTTALMNPGLALRPPMKTFRNINGGQSQQNKTSRAGIQCFNCQDMGHYANKCPKRQQAANPANSEVPRINTMQANKKPEQCHSLGPVR